MVRLINQRDIKNQSNIYEEAFFFFFFFFFLKKLTATGHLLF